MTANKGFLRNTAVMFAAMFISKALGAVLKIPLGNILGGEGMGYFTTAYSIFTPVLSFVCAGIPTVLTRSVAGYAAAGEYRSVFTASCACGRHSRERTYLCGCSPFRLRYRKFA